MVSVDTAQVWLSLSSRASAQPKDRGVNVRVLTSMTYVDACKVWGMAAQPFVRYGAAE